MSETARLSALEATALLDSIPEERFDRITRLAKHALGTDIALISLIDSDRQWFKSKQGLDISETPRDLAFCNHAIRQTNVLIVGDANDDARFKNNPLVMGEPNISFYAGAPLITQSGHALGTLCVIDSKPRRGFSDEDAQMLKDLAAAVMTEIEMVEQLQLISDLNVVNEELRHRMGNMYAHVSALIAIVGRNEDDKEMLVRRLREKISTLGQTQALLAANKWASVSMSNLVRTTLAPYITPSNQERILIQNTDDFDVSPRGAFILTLMLSELGTNAVKHGALGREAGKLSVAWKTGEEMSLTWIESVALDNAKPLGKGFGSQILTRIVPLDLNGEATFDLSSEGLRYHVSAKSDRLALM